MAREISPERKGLYSVGMFLTGAGAVGFFLCFIGFAVAGFQTVDSFGTDGNPIGFWVGAVVCMVLIGVGSAIRRVAARGVAGAGLILDPQRAREDLEPWARMGGGMVKDALDEARTEDGEPQRVMVRCQGCRTLNDEHAKFCDNCGKPL